MKQLTDVYKDDCLKKTAVYEWAKRFREGRESVEDDSREGAPSTSRTAQNVDRLRVRVLGDRRVSLRMLEDELGINKETIRQMLHEDLGMRKLCAKMVPKVLTVEQKELRLSICEDMISRIEEEGEDWMSNVITGDESWVFQYDPETKRQSMQWVEKGGSAPQKPESCQTVNGKFYIEVLKRLKARVFRARPELAERGWVLHHDNAPAHSSFAVRDFLTKNGIPTLPHPPYSPDLAPCDFHLFPQLKSYLKGNRYDGVEEVQRVTTRVLRDLSSGGFRGCFQWWIQRWRRCIELEGDYCEGL
ncbi:histone-lysine N-methyltransferase SETMAR-like [Cylas formicarius]|uniref:histone-lysine N-methyltransferase SETMAR-like n=1 Tax=Cylas formicarius TaxID=197179 RepID=UPI002958A5FB|nr:histone-lysine N-methyltransferase SETMAR-like [Cylas formicarius]